MPTFDTPEPISVVLELILGDVRILATDRADTVVEVSPSDPTNESDVRAAEQTRVEFSQGRLLVKAQKRWRHYGPFGDRESVDVVIELPAGSQVRGEVSVGDVRAEGRLGECRIKTSAGHIWLDRTGSLHLVTGSGDVTVDHADGHVETTGSGEVRIREIAGTAVVKNLNGNTWIGRVTGDLRCSAANGDITVENADGTVAAKTANGSIRIGEAVRGSIVLDTANGALEVGIREGTAALLDVRSRFGRVHNELEVAGGPETSDERVEVRANTGYGDIVIRRP